MPRTPQARPLREPPRPSSRREPLAGVVHELRVLLLEGQDDVADRAVAVFGDDDVRLAWPLRLLVVVLLAVDEHDGVRVLLDLPGFAEVGQDRALLPAALLNGPAELRERDHRDVQLASEGLEATGDLAHLFDAALHPSLVAHQLEVVDDDQPESVLELMVQSPGLGTNLEHACVARVVDPQRGVREAPAGREDLRPAVLGHTALAQLLAPDARL